MTTPARCLDCGRTLIPAGAYARASRDMRRLWSAAGRQRHVGRGLCETCHSRRCRAGTLDERPHIMRGIRADIEEDWAHLGGDSPAWPSRQAAIRALAPRLGMTEAALEQALRRAKQRREREAS